MAGTFSLSEPTIDPPTTPPSSSETIKKHVEEFFPIFRGTASSSHPLRVKDQLVWGVLGCCFIFPFLLGTHGKFVKVNVKLPALVETGALISAIQFFKYEDRLSGKKKLQSHKLAQKAQVSLHPSLNLRAML